MVQSDVTGIFPPKRGSLKSNKNNKVILMIDLRKNPKKGVCILVGLVFKEVISS